MSELDELRKAVRDFLSCVSGSQDIRHLMATPEGYDPAVWSRMAGELGLHGIAVPGDWGGAGAGLPELTVVFEEMGAALLCAPFFATVALATTAVLNSEDTRAIEHFVPAFADGSLVGTLILDGRLGPWDARNVTLTAECDGGEYRVTGDAPRVLDGNTADVILAAANTAAGTTLFAIDADARGLDREPLATLDRTRRLAHVRFDRTPARLVGTEGAAAPGLRRTFDMATVALAAEQVGAAQRCLDMAVGYARERIQFGRAIGSFQAVKHRCADMLVLVEGARSAVMHAASLTRDQELSVAASVAKLVCSDALLQVALDNMRIHGGLGFTWEHDAHLYVRRAKSSQLMFGSPDHHAERLADMVPIT